MEEERDVESMEQEFRSGPRKSRRERREEKKHPILKILLIILVLIIALAISAVLWYNTSLSGIGEENEYVSIEIQMGSGANTIANILKENDLIKHVLAFKIYVRLNNVSSFQAGKYELTKNMSVPEIVEALQTGKVFKEGKKITFVEGKTFANVAKTIADNTNNTEEDVYNLLENEEYIDGLIEKYWFLTDEIKDENIYYSLEGYLFPNTYSFEDENVTVEKIFETLLDQTEKVLDEYKEDIENSKYTVHQLLTIASIIENEAIFDKDRKDISSVIYNRLNANMSIGSDVTTYYAFKINLGSRDLYRSEIDKYNPYNTRGPNMNGKLPVGPISNVSKTSIEAAIFPNETDYLFFVADASGNVYFTKTAQEHDQKVNELKANNAWAQFEN